MTGKLRARQRRMRKSRGLVTLSLLVDGGGGREWKPRQQSLRCVLEPPGLLFLRL